MENKPFDFVEGWDDVMNSPPAEPKCDCGHERKRHIDFKTCPERDGCQEVRCICDGYRPPATTEPAGGEGE